MNKEQITLFKDTMLWKIENPSKGVWFKLIGHTGDWDITDEPAFTSNHLYIPDDQYAVYRKAFVEGKTIQFFNDLYDTSKPEKTWVDLTTLLAKMHFKPHQIRIKPEKALIKVGDWVINTKNKHVFKASKVSNIYIEAQDPLPANYVEDCEKWEPIIGEYVSHKVKDERWIICRYTEEMWNFSGIAPKELIYGLD